MNHEKMGQFILELRKASQMTQKDLAQRLHITDKAVSKWERGLSCPDITLLPSIAEIFGVTTGELLNGERSDTVVEIPQESIEIALQYGDTAARRRVNSARTIAAISFSGMLGIGSFVCGIVDLAVSGGFTWSPIPFSAVVFAWLVGFPLIQYGKKGIVAGMLALSIGIIPFLYVLSRLIAANELFLPIGIRMSAIGIVFLWLVYGLMQRAKERRLLASAGVLLLLIPADLIVNLTLARVIDVTVVDAWDLLGFLVVLLAAGILFAIDTRKRRMMA